MRRFALPLFALLLVAPALAADAPKTDAAATSATTAPAGSIVLKLELPKPMFVGTPTNIKSENLEKVTGRKRADFFVPAGTVLLSKDKPVTGSDDAPTVGDLKQLTDGDKDGADGSYMELGPGKHYVQIDLSAPAKIAAILVWHYHQNARVYRDVVVQLSDDPDFAHPVTVFNNDHDNSSGLGVGADKEYIETNEGKLIDVKGKTARYVRLTSRGNTDNDLNHYVEVEVYGTPQK